MDSNSLASLSFSLSPGIGPKTFLRLISYFGDTESAWDGTKDEFKQIGVGEKTFAKFDDFRKTFRINDYLKQLKEKHVEILAYTDDDYPKQLKMLSDPPIVFFVKGNKNILSLRDRTERSEGDRLLDKRGRTNLDEIKIQVRGEDADQQPTQQENSNAFEYSPQPMIAVVGTRKMTSYGKIVTENLVSELAQDFIIISGLALGVDAQAHKTTLNNDGKTIAVLGCGVDCCNPAENTSLYKEIILSGSAVISEYPLSMPPTPGTFPARNRIVAALSNAILVTEAGEDSGALITAEIAIKLGKKVFAVPGPITSSLSNGTSLLIKNGAKLVTNINDILQELKIDSSQDSSKIDLINMLPAEEKIIVKMLQDESSTVDALCKKTSIKIHQIMPILSNLELKGLVKNSNGRIEIKKL